jgi:hypothetical protein
MDIGTLNKKCKIMDTIRELTKEELIEIEGGIFGNIWEAIGYLFTFHAREVMYSDNAPAVLAYK